MDAARRLEDGVDQLARAGRDPPTRIEAGAHRQPRASGRPWIRAAAQPASESRSRDAPRANDPSRSRCRAYGQQQSAAVDPALMFSFRSGSADAGELAVRRLALCARNRECRHGRRHARCDAQDVLCLAVRRTDALIARPPRRDAHRWSTPRGSARSRQLAARNSAKGIS